MPSFQGIHQDCDEIVKQLITQLREQLRNPKVQRRMTDQNRIVSLRSFLSKLCQVWMNNVLSKSMFFYFKSTPKQLAECVDLLLHLREPADELCDEFITQ
jgi:hypothetical protein